MSPKQPMTEERIAEAAKLWSEGLSTLQIAARMGIPKGTICSTAVRHRSLFPVRMAMYRPIPKPATPKPKRPVGKTFIEGQWIEHVKRTTSTGAVVTMPRVSFIDGVREGAD